MNYRRNVNNKISIGIFVSTLFFSKVVGCMIRILVWFHRSQCGEWDKLKQNIFYLLFEWVNEPPNNNKKSSPIHSMQKATTGLRQWRSNCEIEKKNIAFFSFFFSFSLSLLLSMCFELSFEALHIQLHMKCKWIELLWLRIDWVQLSMWLLRGKYLYKHRYRWIVMDSMTPNIFC